jgi:nucleotide-binding universal stress UspA family protein
MHVVHGVSGVAASVVDKGVLHQYYGEESEKVFKPIRSFFKKQGLEASFVSKVGHASEAIASLAQRGKFDLLVMGSHGQGALTNLVMGSVTTKVLATCSTPVLLIR